MHPSEPGTIEHAIAVMAERHGVHGQGWTWTARREPKAPGWFYVEQRGIGPFDVLIGGRIYLGPDDVEVHLSSNPMLHDFDEAVAVFAATSGTPDPEAIVAEIQRRTLIARGMGDQ